MNIIRNICPHQKRLIQCNICNGGGMCVYSELYEHGYAKKACTVCSKK